MNVAHSTDLMKLHLRIPNSGMLSKECDKSQLIFPFFMFFSKWNRCQVLVVPLSVLFLCCSFHACCHCVLIFGVFPPSSVTFFLLVSPTPSSFLFLTYALCCVTVCTKSMSEISVQLFSDHCFHFPHWAEVKVLCLLPAPSQKRS